jgi:L-ribulose-5-phosphate 3-epimerase
MKNKIGIMQGRLLPKYQGRYQAHPVGYWQDEFVMAQEAGFDCIEFIFDFNDVRDNPLLKDGGINEIKAMIDETGVEVKTICADYFMEAPLHSEDLEVAKQSQKVLIKLLQNAVELDVEDIVIPCVDQSSLNGQAEADYFLKQLSPIVKIAERLSVNLSLETDLAPKPFLELLENFNSDRVTVNYDIGNSAALGYDVKEELATYGNFITDIHIKDRELMGESVVLGRGNADFELFFNLIDKYNYSGPYIMQSYRDDEGVDILKKQLEWVRPYIYPLEYKE